MLALEQIAEAYSVPLVQVIALHETGHDLDDIHSILLKFNHDENALDSDDPVFSDGIHPSLGS